MTDSPDPAPLHPSNTSPPGLITLAWLRAEGADPNCHSYKIVAKEWGESHQMTHETLLCAVENGCDVLWLGERLLTTAEGDRVWKEATAEAHRVWEEAIAEALWRAWQQEVSS